MLLLQWPEQDTYFPRGLALWPVRAQQVRRATLRCAVNGTDRYTAPGTHTRAPDLQTDGHWGAGRDGGQKEDRPACQSRDQW